MTNVVYRFVKSGYNEQDEQKLLVLFVIFSDEKDQKGGPEKTDNHKGGASGKLRDEPDGEIISN